MKSLESIIREIYNGELPKTSEYISFREAYKIARAFPTDPKQAEAMKKYSDKAQKKLKIIDNP